MTSKNVIERILRVCGTTMHNFKYEEQSLNDCFSTALHAYYFVKPGKEMKRFMKKLANCMIDGIKEGMEFADATGHKVQGCVAISIIPKIMKLCIKSFDNRWFEYQINHVDDEEFNERLLDKYIEKLNKEQFSHFYQLITIGYKNSKAFMNEQHCRELWKEINDACKNLNINLPIIKSDYEEFPMFVFESLDSEVLKRILLKHIVQDKDIAGYVARLVYYCEPLVALEYMSVAISFAELFGFRVFN